MFIVLFFHLPLSLKFKKLRKNRIHPDCRKRLRIGSSTPCNADILNLAMRSFPHRSRAPRHSPESSSSLSKGLLRAFAGMSIEAREGRAGWKTELTLISTGPRTCGHHHRCYANSNKHLSNTCCVHCALLGAQGLFLTISLFFFFLFPFWEIFHQMPKTPGRHLVHT